MVIGHLRSCEHDISFEGNHFETIIVVCYKLLQIGEVKKVTGVCVLGVLLYTEN